ncbi:MAG: hypothetical protein RIT35_335 [Pseudomonadota bacterium]|jgi:hypothetical protein
MKDAFSHALRESLKLQYGKLPSAEVVARNFNLRAHGTTPVTQESVRRWIRGESLPKPDHLIILVQWLHLNLNQIYENESHTESACKSEPGLENVCDVAISNGSCKLINEIKKKIDT